MDAAEMYACALGVVAIVNLWVLNFWQRISQCYRQKCRLENFKGDSRVSS